MATAAINPAARVLGWNIELLHQFHGTPFAGIFQPAKGDLTFRDIVEELRLCFEFPQESSGVWDSIAFGLLKTFNYSPDDANPAPKIVHGRDGLDQPVPALPELRREALKDRAVIQYLVFKHKACNLPANSSLNKHFKETCAEHLSDYVRRQDPRYLPPKKASADRRYAAYPFRKTLRGRSSASTSPSKRSASGSGSPRKDADIDQADDDFAGIVVPPNCEIPDHILKRTMANFRAILLQSADSCVVTGMGRSWILNPTIGPALQVCHIVSPLHYHTYPLPSNNVDGTQDTSEVGPRQMKEAWEGTWAPRNGILLFSHLHEMFDQRLFSIHPETLHIRVFMPYDILLEYHGRKAQVNRFVDRAALRHHYDMCRIENMAATLSFIEQLPPTEPSSASAINTPLQLRPSLSRIASPTILQSPSEQSQDEQSFNGDPSKRAKKRGRQHMSGSASPCYDITMDVSWPARQAVRVNQESYITPYNSRDFLANVDWELKKVVSRHYIRK